MAKVYRIDLKKSVVKTIESLDVAIKKRLLEAIDKLAEKPRPRGCRKISGPEADRYRIRVGNYRIIYRVYEDRLLISVIRVAHRRDIYRNL